MNVHHILEPDKATDVDDNAAFTQRTIMSFLVDVEQLRETVERLNIIAIALALANGLAPL